MAHGAALNGDEEAGGRTTQILNKESLDSGETNPLIETQDQQAVIMHDQSIMEVETSDRKIFPSADCEEPLFGPWMLVRKYNKVRGRSPAKDSNGKASSKFRGESSIKNPSSVNGSRFSSLAEANVSMQDSPVNNDNASTLPQVGPKILMNKEVKVRNSAGGKNSQQKSVTKVVGLGPKAKPSRTGPLEKGTKHISKSRTQVDQNAADAAAREEAKMAMKDKEKQMLHRMKILSKKGSNFLEQHTTQVILPNQEIINSLHNNINHVISGSSTSRPPDPSHRHRGMELDNSQSLEKGDVHMKESNDSNEDWPESHTSYPSQ
ncbi:hypothetical protein RIF29_33927 [Crotalaria pallida]|uniref:Uncharacterized protein n=1 Tax=Crotalaria pallida TaxID=3830 RepID=A0AAN9EB55_CROPI